MSLSKSLFREYIIFDYEGHHHRLETGSPIPHITSVDKSKLHLDSSMKDFLEISFVFEIEKESIRNSIMDKLSKMNSGPFLESLGFWFVVIESLMIPNGFSRVLEKYPSIFKPLSETFTTDIERMHVRWPNISTDIVLNEISIKEVFSLVEGMNTSETGQMDLQWDYLTAAAASQACILPPDSNFYLISKWNDLEVVLSQVIRSLTGDSNYESMEKANFLVSMYLQFESRFIEVYYNNIGQVDCSYESHKSTLEFMGTKPEVPFHLDWSPSIGTALQWMRV